MEATVINYRRGMRTQNPLQMILEPLGVKTHDEAKKLIGKKVTFTTEGGKKIVGKILATHGNGPAIRARFNKGLPGQAIGKKVEIAE